MLLYAYIMLLYACIMLLYACIMLLYACLYVYMMYAYSLFVMHTDIFSPLPLGSVTLKGARLGTSIRGRLFLANLYPPLACARCRVHIDHAPGWGCPVQHRLQEVSLAGTFLKAKQVEPYSMARSLAIMIPDQVYPASDYSASSLVCHFFFVWTRKPFFLGVKKPCFV